MTAISYAYPNGYAGDRHHGISQGYDEFGRLASVDNGVTHKLLGYTDSQNVFHPGYDDLDHEQNTQTVYYGGSGTPLFSATVDYTFYPNGSRKGMAIQSGSDPVAQFSYYYDQRGRLTSEVNPAQETYSWSYLDNNWLQTQELANGVSSAYTLNSLGQVVDITTTDGTDTLSEFGNIIYDGAGNRTQLQAAYSGAPSFNGTQTYTYDGRDQLTSEGTNLFAYDGQSGTSTGPGNPTTMRGTSQSYSANGDNQLTGIGSNTGFGYDGNGNPTVYAGQTMTFDSNNHLLNYGGVSNNYSLSGMRVSKKVGNSQTYFLYSASGMGAICELDAAGHMVATNTYGSTGLVARSSGNTSTQYVFDPQGNVAQRLDGTGRLLSCDLYDAFGKQTTTASTPDVFGFGARFGYYSDYQSGLLLLGTRFYDAQSGRFLNRDSKGYGGGVNLYGYVHNRPLVFTDPSGQECIDIGPIFPEPGDPITVPRPTPVDPTAPTRDGAMPSPQPIPQPVQPEPDPEPVKGPSPGAPAPPIIAPRPRPGGPALPPPPADGGGGGDEDSDDCDPFCVPEGGPTVDAEGGVYCLYTCTFGAGPPELQYIYIAPILGEECPPGEDVPGLLDSGGGSPGEA